MDESNHSIFDVFKDRLHSIKCSEAKHLTSLFVETIIVDTLSLFRFSCYV